VLSESSYLTAIYTYVGAAVALLIYLTWVLSRYWGKAWVTLVVLICAALLLTPAHPDAEISTFAPALIVAVFEGLINGPEAAQHAIKPLTYLLALALLLSLLLRITLFRTPQLPSGSNNE
jgi:hypothetical protein